MKLTDVTIKALRPPQAGQAEHRDDTLPNFMLRVSQGGTKVFYVIVRRRRVKIGPYPLISLAKARQKASELLAEKILGKDKPRTIRFDTALTDFLENYTGRKERTTKDVKSILNRHFLPSLRDVRLGDIAPEDITRVTDRLRGMPTTARHALANVKMFFEWCIGRNLLTTNPCARLDLPKKPPGRERVLSNDELRKVFLHARQTAYPFGPMVQLLILTGQRRTEVGSLKWPYIAGDLVTLPPELTKNNHQHTFPLCEWAQQIVVSIPHRNNNDYLFPSWSKRAEGKYTKLEPLDKPFSNWSNPKEEFDEGCPIEHWTLHDLRRTLSTGFAALGIRQEVTEKLLNHVSGGSMSAVARIYNRHAYVNEMREAVRVWQNHLEKLIGQPARPTSSA